MILNFLLLTALFLLLGWSADLVVVNLRKTGEKLGIKVFFLGLLLGLFTSAPETALGINAIVKDIEEVSVGNLLGGIMVIFGLVLSLSLVLNRKTATDGKISHIFPVLLFLLLPMLLGLDGMIGFIDGVVLILGYVGLVWYLYRVNGGYDSFAVEVVEKKDILKHLFKIVLGIIFVIIVSHYVVQVTIDLLGSLNISKFFIGTIIIAVGTNLPEIIISLRSWRRNLGELSVSNLIGSALANVLIIGLLATFKVLSIDNGLSYSILFIALLTLFGLLTIFYKTDNKLGRVEGVVLFLVYLGFVATEVYFLK